MNRRILTIGATMALASTAVLASGASAQEMAPHPAHIHVGSCPAPGDVVGPLSDVSGQFLMDGAATVTPAMGSGAAIPVEASFTSAVAVAYTDIFAAPHSVVVHQSADDIGTYILCGDIGGPEMGMTDIAIGLGALNDSGYTGIATIHDNGDSTLKVSVYITTGQPMMAEPAASPAP
ncbi:MAG TPA: hypothetical protein VJZ50_00435 [Candidatus Limnocylindrales bacterium]|nr:hypothetical protein [Candidatus Limnocylindrales bacterium]